MTTATRAKIADAPTFERAHQAIRTLRTLRDKLSTAERETLAILLDKDAVDTIAESTMQAERGQFERLEDAASSHA